MSDYTESRNEEMIRAIIDDTSYHTDYTQGRNEQILQSIIDNMPYTKDPESRMEELLLELKQKIEGGGGDYQAKSVMPDFSDGDVVVTPDSGYSALSSVTVEKDTDLIASNIKKDVEIFGVTGSYEMPSDIETDMNAVLNKKMGTSTTYAPDTWADTVNLMGKLPEKTASGAIASFDDGADDVPIAEGVFNIDYDANGFTGCNIVKAGKNLCKPYAFAAGIYTYSSNGKIKVSGTVSSTAYTPTTSQATSNNICFVLKAGTYTPSVLGTLPTGAFINVVSENNVSLSQGAAFTLTEETKVFYRIVVPEGTYDFEVYAQIERGSTATAYEPYNANVYNVDWTTEAGTVYGGTFNATTGVLTSTKAADGSDLATPQTYQLTPQQINTLLGVNNIYCDTGDSSVTYRADIDLALQNL